MKDIVVFACRASLAVVKEPAIGSGENGAEQHVGGTRGTNIDDDSYK